MPDAGDGAVAHAVGGARRRVVIVQRRMTEYRIPLFERLRAELAQRNVSLDVLYGTATPGEQAKNDGGALDWATPINTRYAFSDRICWQPFGAHLRGADLVVVTQENKLLYNYWLLAFPPKARLAFWGHGRNLQSARPGGVAERIKRWSTSRVDWWFAYTDLSAEIVTGAGFPRERITVLDNSIDTGQLERDRLGLTQAQIYAARESLGLGGGPVGIYVGSLYKEKRIEFLVEACRRLRAKLAGFQLLIAGDGPDRARLQHATQGEPWIVWCGVRRGMDKAALFAVSDVVLNPGLVGLGILDSFVFGVPMVTTDCGLHSPEISYLHHGQNGLIVEDNLEAYSGAVAGLLSDPDRLARLEAGCRASAGRYTVENMAMRFSDGISNALRAGKYRR